MTLCLVLSDVHDGKNSATFSQGIFEKRILGIPKALANHPLTRDIRDLVIILGGDMVEGEDIYPNQQINLTEPVFDQAHHAASTLERMLKELHTTLELRKLVVHSVPGNHGRMSKTAHTKSNWDNVMYAALAEKCKADTAIKFTPNYEGLHVVEIGGHRILVDHYGVPHLGSAPHRLNFLSWMTEYKCSALVRGHYHHLTYEQFNRKWLIGNGSLSGVDDYSERLARFDNAQQALFNVHRKHGVVDLSWLEW